MHEGCAAQPFDRRHVDDRAAPGLGHRLDGHPHAQEGSGEVDVNHLLPLGQIEVLQLPECHDAGVVDQHVEFPEFTGGGRDGGVPLIGLRHVEVDVARGVTDFGSQRLALLVEDVADHHLGAFGHQHSGVRGAHAPGAATDQRNFAVYPSHEVGFLSVEVSI